MAACSLSHVQYHGFLAGDLNRLSWPMRQDGPRASGET